MADKIYAVQILAPAQIELEDIAQVYLSLAGVQYARKITDKIYNALEQLAHFPLSGSPVHDKELFNLGYRFIVVEKYIIIYRLIDETVYVYHLFDGRTDYPTLLQTEFFN